MLTKLLDTLEKLGLETTAEDVADLLWLADRLPAPQATTDERPPIPLGVAPSLKGSSESTPRSSLPPDRREKFVTLHNEESTDSQSSTGTATLYPIQAAGGTVTGNGAPRRVGATFFRSAAAYALPAPLEVGRSLRPLKKRTPSRTQTMIDEIATAERIADTIAIFGTNAGFWTPVIIPTPERWLELALVVDESSSMLIWERTISEFVTLLERQGAFRDIQCWGLRSDPTASQPASAKAQLYAGIAGNAQRDRLRQPGELLDERGQRLILVVSDCVAPIWHNGQAAALLMRWGHHGPVALVQMLPERMWQRTGLRNFPSLHLRSPQPASINRNLEIFWSSDWFDPPAKGVPLPVVTLQADWLANWARALAGNSGLWLPGVMLHTEAAEVIPSHENRSAEQLISDFYATASPLAQQLAIYLACAPLTLPIMRLVQRVMLPEARQIHLAEVLVSGLLVRPTPGASYEPADLQNFSFVQGVRELLINNLRKYEMERVTSAISTYVGERSGKQILDFRALLADPEAEGTLTIDETYQPFAEVTAAVLRRFGSQYARAAARLEKTAYGREVHKPATASAVNVGKEPGRKTEQRPRTGKTTTIHALLIGINRYAEPGVTALSSCDSDVYSTRGWLQERFRLSTSTAQLLIDREATKSAIMQALNGLVERVQEGEYVYIHYSGRDQAIATDDVHEGDGLEETLFVYDSKSNDRNSLIPHRELIDVLKKLDQRGAQVVLFLDTCRAGSGYLCRQDLGDILVIATSHEAEQSYEGPIGDVRAGYASYYLAEAMRKSQPGTTWAEVFDAIYVNVQAKQSDQTPQWIGPRDLCIFSEERKAVAPYLLLTEMRGDEVTVRAHAALGLELGARLALYPPGSEMSDPPLRYATVNAVHEHTITATLERSLQKSDPHRSVVVGFRVRIVAPTAEPLLTVDWDSEITAPTNDPLFRTASPQESPDYQLRIEREPTSGAQSSYTEAAAPSTWRLEEIDGRVVWQQPLEANADPSTPLDQARKLLHAIACYRRVFALQPPAEASDLTDAVELTVLSPQEAEEGTILADQPTQVRLHNRSETDLYISLWTLDNHLAIQRIYPPASDCLLLGKGHQIQLAMTLNLSDPDQAEEQMTFKVFASRTPADLSGLQQERMTQAVDLGDLEELTRRLRTAARPVSSTARKVRAQKQAVDAAETSSEWKGGGPVALRNKLWQNGRTLRIRFVNGEPTVQAKVAEIAQEWTHYANLHFEFGDFPDAEIRIAFEQGAGSWSYIGTDCLSIAKDQPTMNLGWLTPTTSQTETKRVVLHEFGHALGLAASNQSPVANIPWDRQAAYDYYQKTSGWTKQQVDSNLFQKYAPEQVIYGQPDPDSIMYHPFPKELTDGKLEIVYNLEISELEKAFMADLYPKEKAAA